MYRDWNQGTTRQILRRVLTEVSLVRLSVTDGENIHKKSIEISLKYVVRGGFPPPRSQCLPRLRPKQAARHGGVVALVSCGVKDSRWVVNTAYNQAYSASSQLTLLRTDNYS